MKTLFSAAVLAVGVACATGAVAQETAPTAEQIRAAAEQFDLGREAFKATNYAEAAEYFEAADRHAPSAAALELAIRSRDRAGQLHRAATLAALAAVRHPEKRELVQLTQEILDRARQDLQRVRVTCDEPCEVLVDMKLVHGPPSTDRIIYLEPGNYAIRASWPGERVASERVTATAGGEAELEFEQPAERSAAEAELPDPLDDIDAAGPEDTGAAGRKGWSPTVFWIGAGLTAVAGGVTAWSGIDTVNNPGQEAVRNACRGQDESCPEYQEGLEKQRRTNILLGVTAGLGVATLIVGLFATDWGGGKKASAQAAPPPKRFGVEPWIRIDHGATLGAAGRF